MRTLVSIVIWTLCVWTLTEANCDIDPAVNNATEKAHQETLLQKLDPLMGKRAKLLKTVNGYTYDFVVCGAVDSQHSGVSIVQTGPGNPKETKVLGYNNQTVVSSQGNWLMLTFKGGDTYNNSCDKGQREAHILFVCDPFQKELEIHTVEEMTEESCHLQFVVPHKTICPTAPEEGLGGGAIFFILLLVTFGAYFTFGFFYLRLVQGAKGIEQIPNVGFWFKFGNILADGCGAIFRCDQYCGNANANPSASGIGSTSTSTYNGYSPIEERMARDLQETDRDSALLSP